MIGTSCPHIHLDIRELQYKQIVSSFYDSSSMPTCDEKMGVIRARVQEQFANNQSEKKSRLKNERILQAGLKTPTSEEEADFLNRIDFLNDVFTTIVNNYMQLFIVDRARKEMLPQIKSQNLSPDEQIQIILKYAEEARLLHAKLLKRIFLEKELILLRPNILNNDLFLKFIENASLKQISVLVDKPTLIDCYVTLFEFIKLDDSQLDTLHVLIKEQIRQTTKKTLASKGSVEKRELKYNAYNDIIYHFLTTGILLDSLPKEEPKKIRFLEVPTQIREIPLKAEETLILSESEILQQKFLKRFIKYLQVKIKENKNLLFKIFHHHNKMMVSVNIKVAAYHMAELATSCFVKVIMRSCSSAAFKDLEEQLSSDNLMLQERLEKIKFFTKTIHEEAYKKLEYEASRNRIDKNDPEFKDHPAESAYGFVFTVYAIDAFKEAFESMTDDVERFYLCLNDLHLDRLFREDA